MKKAGTKRTTRHTITFEDDESSMVVALAKIRGGNTYIKRKTGLSDHQIQYRLSKAQALEGRKGGYRIGFSNGTSPEFQRIERDYCGVFQAEIQRKLPKLITHPTPKMVKVKESKPVTVPTLVKEMEQAPKPETAEQRRERLAKLKARYEAEFGRTSVDSKVESLKANQAGFQV